MKAINKSLDYAKVGFRPALKDVARLSVPITVTQFLLSMLLFLNLVWIGHHATSNQFAGAALAIMIINVIGNSLCLGMTSGLDTQCGQAWGAKIMGMVGIFTQRSIIVSHIMILGIMVIFIYGEQILILLQQNKRASYYAGTYIWIYMGALWAVSMFFNLIKFLQAQRKVKPIPVAVVAGVAAQLVSLLIFVNGFGLGFYGAAICLPISYWVMFAVLLLFTIKRGLYKECWMGWDCNQAMREWRPFLDLSIPGTAMLCAELWAFQLLALVAGTFSNSYLSAFNVCLNTLAIFIRIPLGVSIACAVLVSNKLGAKLAQSAKIAWHASLCISMSCSFVCACLMFFGARGIAHVYTSDTAVINKVEVALPYAAVYFLIDSYQRCSAGAVRGLGRQFFGSVTYLCSYYLIGMPIGIYLAVTGMHLKGLWIGAGISVTVCSCFFLGLYFWLDWDNEVARAQERLRKEKEKLEKFKRQIRERFGTVGVFDPKLSTENLRDHNQQWDNHSNVSGSVNKSILSFGGVDQNRNGRQSEIDSPLLGRLNDNSVLGDNSPQNLDD